MTTVGKNQNFVLFDLSTLDTATASGFLAELASRTDSRSVSFPGPCHWIVSPVRSLDLLSARGPGPDFLRERLNHGDPLFCSHPSGLAWQGLFPMEAEQEFRALTALISRETQLFLAESGAPPPWMHRLSKPVFRPTANGLCVHFGNDQWLVPWGPGRPGEVSSHRRGVCWIVPGQALVAPLPAAPWADLTLLRPAHVGRKAPAVLRSVSAHTFSPKAKLVLSRISELRRSGGNSPLHQAILFHTQEYPGLGTREAVDFDASLGGIRKRALVANMQGVTDFQESGLKVRFQGGRLVRIEDSVRKEILCHGAESSMTWNGRKHPFVTNSAFSFEGDFSWGLRQSLVLDHEDLSEPGRLILDFFFVEESREFFVAATVRWPKWKQTTTVQEWAPLKLEMLGPSATEALGTRVLWPDGRSQDELHRKGPRQGILCGTDFVFGLGKTGLVLGFPQNQSPRPHYLPWRVERSWRGKRLFLNPEGGDSARPSSEFEGVEEHFHFYLNRSEGAKLPFSVTRKQATELIPPYVIDSAPIPES
ncbi:MAG: hypothetical protein WCG80_10845 [Spirochaetales bacterium]